MLRTIRKYIEQHNLLQPDVQIIVGLSGGADSVALIHVLNGDRERLCERFAALRTGIGERI